jgi:hypothetical protein
MPYGSLSSELDATGFHVSSPSFEEPCGKLIVPFDGNSSIRKDRRRLQNRSHDEVAGADLYGGYNVAGASSGARPVAILTPRFWAR